MEEQEILLKPNTNRFVLFPIQHQDIWELYKKTLSSFWVSEEIDFSADLPDWNSKITDNEKFFIKNILAFFAFSDGVVNENLAMNFHNEIQIPEARALYTSQMLIESVHNECYSLMINTLIEDQQERLSLFNAFQENPIVNKKAQWAMKWFNKERSFGERLIAFGVVEGVFFSGSFCAIFWLKSRGLMPGLSTANEIIARDEATHVDTCVLLYSKLKNRLNEKTVHAIFQEAYLIEKEFITESIPVSLIGMNSGSMTQYIQFICDFWIVKLGYSKLFNVTNPYAFMDYSSFEIKTNFFEKINTQYSKAIKTTEDLIFNMDADF
jgi:ribonucleoside-diphosphate reductase beta chain